MLIVCWQLPAANIQGVSEFSTENETGESSLDFKGGVSYEKDRFKAYLKSYGASKMAVEIKFS